MRRASVPRAVRGRRTMPVCSAATGTCAIRATPAIRATKRCRANACAGRRGRTRLSGERLVNWVRDEVFPFHAELAAGGTTDFMDGARLVIDEPTVLTQVVSQLNDLHLDRVDADTKGDLFEHVLRQIRQAGELGQFRTPRHVIRALVRLVDPRIGETV